jgi:predicted nucleotidyltransferase
MATKLPQDFKEFLKLLNDNHVEYLLVGGYAVAYYGYPRPTGDMDIWVPIRETNSLKVVSVLRQFGFDVPELDVSLFAEPGRVIRMGQPPMRLELLTSIDGVEFDTAFADKVIDTIDSISINIISLNDLRTNKKAAARPKDLDDLSKLIN